MSNTYEEIIINQLKEISGAINVLRAENSEEFRRVYDKIDKSHTQIMRVNLKVVRHDEAINRLSTHIQKCNLSEVSNKINDIETDIKDFKKEKEFEERDTSKIGIFFKIVAMGIGVCATIGGAFWGILEVVDKLK